MNWKNLELHGCAAISRLCGEYVIEDTIRLAGAQFRIKVFEREHDFVAFPNIRFRTPNGSIDGTCGLGSTELEALQDAIARVAGVLAARARWEEQDLEWVDPRDS